VGTICFGNVMFNLSPHITIKKTTNGPLNLPIKTNRQGFLAG